MGNDRHTHQRRWLANAVGLLVIGGLLTVVYGIIILAFLGVNVVGP